MLITARSTVIL